MLIALLAAVYLSEPCGFSFEYPDSWSVVERASCTVDVQAANGDAVHVVRRNRKLEVVAEEALFLRISQIGGWATMSPHGLVPAAELTTDCCRGVRGTTWSRSENAIVVMDRAVMNDRRGHSAVVEARHSEHLRPVVTLIVRTLRFNYR